jgi:hypothetical protein
MSRALSRLSGNEQLTCHISESRVFATGMEYGVSVSDRPEVVLLLHDAFQDKRIWDRFGEALPVGRFQLCAPDIPSPGVASSAAWAARVHNAGECALGSDTAAIVVSAGSSTAAAVRLFADRRARSILLFQPHIDGNLRSRLRGTLSDDDIVRFGHATAEPLGSALSALSPGAGFSNAQALELVSIMMEPTAAGWDPTVRQEIQEMLAGHLAEWSRCQRSADADTAEPWTRVLGRCPPTAPVTIVLGPTAGLVHGDLILAAYRESLPGAAIIQRSDAEYLWMRDPATAVRLFMASL